ncbi:MAG TPA: acetate--CoA ligase family protein [Beijerinckiaceae bacterium]|nr:acetate--CoA ligase family protein [Beijerinckiaceae bacterium]
MDLEASRKKVEALTAPGNVVLVGASDRPGGWAARVWRNLNHYKFPGNLHLINPRRDEIWERPCYPDFASMPEPPDHMVVLVPAAQVPEVLRAGAAAGARSATIFSSGFGEAYDEEGLELGRQLRQAIRDTGLGVSGPNCMGNICARSGLVTLTEDRPLKLSPGPVALVGQSGGVMIFVNQALEERGIAAEYLITSGNEAGLTVADYIAFFASEPEIKVILVYIEALKDAKSFASACRVARQAGKSVVAMKLGQSQAGRAAAMAHTASLAGSMEAFDALAADIGVIRAETLDDAVEITELLAHTGAPKGTRLGAVTLSGAYRGLLLDAAERNGLTFPTLAPETKARMDAVLAVGSLVSNPVDGGFGVLTSEDTYRACLDALQADPNVDMVLLQESVPRQPGSARAERYIRLVGDYAAAAAKPTAFVTLTSHGHTDYSRALRAEAPRVSFLQEANKALRAIGAAARASQLEALAPDGPAIRAPSEGERLACERVRASARSGAASLNEAESKALLRAYGFALPAEELTVSADAAVSAARRIGYPVVMKGVSPTLLHKSDAGAVMLGVAGDDAVRAAWASIFANVQAYGHPDPLEGVLVAEQVSGGIELALGVHRDPEIGLVVMAGAGGVLLELIKDASFAVPPITPDKARNLLAQTRVAKLMAGYRGARPSDTDAVVQALLALGRIADDLRDVVESIDINPFVALEQGGRVLDALVVLRNVG